MHKSKLYRCLTAQYNITATLTNLTLYTVWKKKSIMVNSKPISNYFWNINKYLLSNASWTWQRQNHLDATLSYISSAFGNVTTGQTDKHVVLRAADQPVQSHNVFWRSLVIGFTHRCSCFVARLVAISKKVNMTPNYKTNDESECFVKIMTYLCWSLAHAVIVLVATQISDGVLVTICKMFRYFWITTMSLQSDTTTIRYISPNIFQLSLYL